MRGWMLPAALAVAMTALPAAAQGQKEAPPAKPGQAAQGQSQGQGTPAPANRVVGSNLAGVAFTEAPFPLADDGTYAAFMNEVAAALGRKACGKVESFGWEFKSDDLAQQQKSMDRIFQTTMQGFAVKGYAVKEVSGAPLPDPAMIAYSAERAKEKRTLLMVWAPLEDSAMLLICGPETKPAANGDRKK